MTIKELLATVTNKDNFLTLENYIEFCQRYLAFAAVGLQAVIIAKNEPNYCFFQYRQDGHFNFSFLDWQKSA